MKLPSILSDVSSQTLERLELFSATLLRWNARLNLVARGDEAFLAERHIADSLQLAPLIPPTTTGAVDLGSGAGFPGLILAVATGLPFDLIEADQRKAAFLREVARLTGAPVTVHASRIEATPIPAAGLVTARALAPLAALLRFSEPLLAPDGACLFLKGKAVESELTSAYAGWQMQVERFPSRTRPGATILRITELHRVAPSA